MNRPSNSSSEKGPPRGADQLADFPAVIGLPVLWGDQDAFGHVNNVAYLRWFESSRIRYFEHVGVSDSMAARRIGPILASIKCDYRQQLTYPDTVHIGARVVRIGRSSIALEHKLVSEQLTGVVAEAQSTVVVFDYNQNQPHPVPDEIRQRIASLEGREF